jgi:hypothetical protein
MASVYFLSVFPDVLFGQRVALGGEKGIGPVDVVMQQVAEVVVRYQVALGGDKQRPSRTRLLPIMINLCMLYCMNTNYYESETNFTN